MRNNRNLWPLSGLLAATLWLGGCFNEAEQEAQTPKDQRIKLAMLQPPRSGLTPLSDDAFKLSRWSTAETLVVLDDKGEAQPMLATAWEKVDETTWRFTLRENVHFHDNSVLDANTVVNALSVAATASQIGRAACRGRAQLPVAAVSLK